MTAKHVSDASLRVDMFYNVLMDEFISGNYVDE